MTTLQIKTDLKLKIKDKSATELVSIYENNKSRLKAGSDLEDGLIINDVCIEEMENRLTKINFFVGGLIDNQIAYYFKTQL